MTEHNNKEERPEDQSASASDPKKVKIEAFNKIVLAIYQSKVAPSIKNFKGMLVFFILLAVSFWMTVEIKQAHYILNHIYQCDMPMLDEVDAGYEFQFCFSKQHNSSRDFISYVETVCRSPECEIESIVKRPHQPHRLSLELYKGVSDKEIGRGGYESESTDPFIKRFHAYIGSHSIEPIYSYKKVEIGGNEGQSGVPFGVSIFYKKVVPERIESLGGEKQRSWIIGMLSDYDYEDKMFHLTYNFVSNLNRVLDVLVLVFLWISPLVILLLCVFKAFHIIHSWMMK